MSKRNRVVMVAGEGQSTRLVFHALKRAFGVHKVVIEGPVPRKQFLERRIKRLGLRTVAGQMLFKAMIDQPLRLRSAPRIRQIIREHGLDDGPLPEDDVTRVSSINDPEALDRLLELDPSVVVVNGTRIIAKKVLEAVRAPFINMHAGITPLYRGVHGAYWALAKGDRAHCGVTVHLVDPGIDTGAIIGQALIEPTPKDNFATYGVLQVATGLPVMIAAVRAALDGTMELKSPPDGASRLFSHPTLGEYMKARIQSGVR